MSLRTDMVAWWELDEASGTRVDSHGSNDLTDNNTVGQSSGGGPGGQDVAQFVIENDEYLSIADNADLSFGDEDFSICIWSYFDSLTTVTYPLGKGDNLDSDHEYRIFYSSGSDAVKWEIFGGTGKTNGTQVTGLSSPSLSTWYFLYCYHDSVNNEIGMSVNDGTPVTGAHTAGCWDGGNPVNLGTLDGNTNWTQDGRSGMAAIWNRVLTASEVTKLYNSGSGLSYSQTGFTPKTIIY